MLHGSFKRDPYPVCTVKRLGELLAEMDPDCPVMVAIGEDESGLSAGGVLSVTYLREPIEGNQVALIVPHGALGPEYLEMLTRQAAIEESGEEPS